MAKILLAEDEADIAFLIEFSLCRRAPHDITVAQNGAEAVRLFRAAREAGAPFDLVVMDIGMPLLSGDQAALAIRRLDSRVVILFLTGYGEDSDPVKNARRCPRSELLMKPDDLMTLPDHVARALSDAEDLSEERSREKPQGTGRPRP
jgi:DNA-binding response OmpR family regulator